MSAPMVWYLAGLLAAPGAVVADTWDYPYEFASTSDGSDNSLANIRYYTATKPFVETTWAFKGNLADLHQNVMIAGMDLQCSGVRYVVSGNRVLFPDAKYEGDCVHDKFMVGDKWDLLYGIINEDGSMSESVPNRPIMTLKQAGPADAEDGETVPLQVGSTCSPDEETIEIKGHPMEAYNQVYTKAVAWGREDLHYVGDESGAHFYFFDAAACQQGEAADSGWRLDDREQSGDAAGCEDFFRGGFFGTPGGSSDDGVPFGDFEGLNSDGLIVTISCGVDNPGLNKVTVALVAGGGLLLLVGCCACVCLLVRKRRSPAPASGSDQLINVA